MCVADCRWQHSVDHRNRESMRPDRLSRAIIRRHALLANCIKAEVLWSAVPTARGKVSPTGHHDFAGAMMITPCIQNQDYRFRGDAVIPPWTNRQTITPRHSLWISAI